MEVRAQRKGFLDVGRVRPWVDRRHKLTTTSSINYKNVFFL